MTNIRFLKWEKWRESEDIIIATICNLHLKIDKCQNNGHKSQKPILFRKLCKTVNLQANF